MNLKNRPPVFVPAEHRREIEALSKAALMDMVWDYAAQHAETVDAPDAIMDEFRRRREIVMLHRKQATT